ncbi:MAG: hypothetical protein WC873_01095 [Candidatus Gracilibacteria bacterium]
MSELAEIYDFDTDNGTNTLFIHPEVEYLLRMPYFVDGWIEKVLRETQDIPLSERISIAKNIYEIITAFRQSLFSKAGLNTNVESIRPTKSRRHPKTEFNILIKGIKTEIAMIATEILYGAVINTKIEIIDKLWAIYNQTESFIAEAQPKTNLQQNRPPPFPLAHSLEIR